ncbi:MAG TPA: glutathione synthase [Methylophilaceae bacterium]
MHLAFILDPLDTLKAYKDTSLAIMREAAQRGHQLYVGMQGGLLLRHDKVKLITQSFKFIDMPDWYGLGLANESALCDFDAVLMRKDPPFDNEYLYSTYLLELAAGQGARILNNPASVRSWNEKLSIARFSQFAPAFLVTRDNDLIRDFLAEHGDIVVKPLDGMGGSGVFRLQTGDPNINVILETITDLGQRMVMAQRYLLQIKQGDKRIIVIDGEPLPYALARIPKAGETRGNLAAGGTGVAQLLTDRDREIATIVGKVLKQHGLFLVGLDVIGDYLTEINVTSPTGMVEIATQTQGMKQACNPAQIFVDVLERECATT